jgi:hypothetical protein
MPTVQFWLNAFIPRTVPGYTRTLTAGRHTGKTAVPLPGVAFLWPGNWGKSSDAGYLGDQRTFDSSPTASCRMQSILEVDVSGPPRMVGQTHRSSGTTEVNLVSGAQTGFAVADMSRCSYAVIPPPPPPGPPGGGVGPFAGHTSAGRGGTAFPTMRPTAPPTSISVRLVGQAGDPLVGMAADIDYTGTVTIAVGSAPGSLRVSFDGLIDAFPAYDCYAQFDGVTKTLFTNSPPPGNTVADLLGNANRPIVGRVSFP